MPSSLVLKSPLDDIPDLEQIPQEKVDEFEARLSKRFEGDRDRRIAEGKAREEMRKVRLF